MVIFFPTFGCVLKENVGKYSSPMDPMCLGMVPLYNSAKEPVNLQGLYNSLHYLPCDFEDFGVPNSSSFSRKIHHPWHQFVPRYHKVWRFPSHCPPFSLRQSYVAYWARFLGAYKNRLKVGLGEEIFCEDDFPWIIFFPRGSWKIENHMVFQRKNQSFWLALPREWGNESPQYPCIASFPHSLPGTGIEDSPRKINLYNMCADH